MKLSISLSDSLFDRAGSFADRLTEGNLSRLVALALEHFLASPARELEQIARRSQFERMAVSRTGWQAAFWGALGEEMGREDRIENCYAARDYGGNTVALLLNRVNAPDEESDPFPIYVGVRMQTQGTPPGRQWTFSRAHSPVRAASEVAEYLRTLGWAP